MPDTITPTRRSVAEVRAVDVIATSAGAGERPFIRRLA